MSLQNEAGEKNPYSNRVREILSGEAPELADIRGPRLGKGMGLLLQAHWGTSGGNRILFNSALGDLIAAGEAHPVVIAQAVHFVAIRDLAELETHIERLEELPVSQNADIQTALRIYRSRRELYAKGVLFRSP